ncbi:MAG: glycerol-3-phosphate 1-O-acyltransferase [alpha proteobacterium HIMB59]|nr:MAG: glycerol-3-phosphate 1-O-acyltransferase [alpha proteobacterium HIMB59]
MIISLFFAYLIGSVPFGKIITKILINKDITQTGSGNIGATNVYRSVSKKAGILVLILDAIKPIIALTMIQYLNPNLFNEYKFIFFLVSIIGHIFPIWLKFKGGKGVACFFGGNLLLMPIPTIFSMIIWLLVVKFSKLSSFGALLSIFVLTSYELIFIYGTLNKGIILLLFVLIFLKHSSNIKRLIKGQENKIDL